MHIIWPGCAKALMEETQFSLQLKTWNGMSFTEFSFRVGEGDEDGATGDYKCSEVSHILLLICGEKL